MSVISELRMRPHLARGAGWDASGTARLLLSAAVIFVLLCGANLATPLYPQLQADLALGPVGTTIAFSSYVLALIFFLLVVGHWSDHIGRRAALLLAVLLGLLGTMVFGAASSLAELCAGRALQGLSVALATGASAAALRELLPQKPEWASRFTLLASSGGVAIGPLLGGLLSLLPGGRSTAFTVHAAALVLLLVPLLVLRARPAIAVPGPGSRHRVLAPRGVQIPREGRTQFLLAALTGFLSFAVYGFILSLAPGYFTQVFTIHSLPLIGLLAGLALASSALVQLPMIYARFAEAAALAGLALGVLVLAAGLHWAQFWLVVVAMLGVGLCQGVAFRLTFSSALGQVPESAHARTVSSIYVATYLGSALPVIGLGWAAGRFGLETSITVFVLGCSVLGLCLAAISAVIERRRQLWARRIVEA